MKFIDRLLTMFNLLLIVAGILEYILLGIDFKANFANTYLGAILIGVALINAFIDFYQLQKSEAILASFLAMIPPTCRVVRDGTIKSIAAAGLVKGDIVLLRSGDKTPADLLIFASSELKVDNSSLTGESEPQERFPMPHGSQLRPAEAENLTFNSTLIVNGEAWGIAVRTGDNTFIGQIASLTGSESDNKSPLAVEIGAFVIILSTIAVIFAIAFFAVGLATVYKGKIAATVTFAVSILVAFVPEGLPSVVTLLLSIAAKRMAAQNVLVKDLQGVETLGSLTLLATDKTGTLTRNQMTVFPFNSTNKWALVVLKKTHANGCLSALLKGAPERVLAKCTTYLKDGTAIPITDEFRKAYDEAYNYMASRGHRVIGCAQNLLPGEQYAVDHVFTKNDLNYPSEGYCFIGLVSLEDPPKHGVREAIGTLRLAGIKVMMVTGDHPKTAEAIARKINLVLGETRESLSAKTGRPIEEIYEDETSAIMIHGDDLDSLEGWQWDQIFNKQEIVFARTTPKHKLEIVKRAQALGHVVGVTGDGVNDSPALKKADLGIAMNISGSDVSKEAANMILLDDNFASTVKGVAEGRLIFNNLKRSIQYTISHSTPEIIPQLLYVVVPLPLAISAILILVIDLGFDLFMGLTFAWDKPESDDGLMRLKPRKPVTDRSILSLKRRALRRVKTIGMDAESQDRTSASKIRRFIERLKAPFTKVFWQDLFEETDHEKLVDRGLLSYAYLEAGIIETISGLLVYFVVFWKCGFTPAEVWNAQKAGVYFVEGAPNFVNSRGQVIDAAHQLDGFAQAQSSVYLSIFINQCFNVFAVKAKLTFPFGRRVVSNKWNFVGILIGASLGTFVIYTPPLHIVFGGSHHLLPLYWLIPAAFGILLLIWASIRVILLRKSIQDKTVKDIKGLMMYDNFASTVKGVAEGRLIFNNLKRSIQSVLLSDSSNQEACLINCTASSDVVVPLPLAISAILILVIDLGFDLFMGLTFAWDKPESDDGLMRLKPRKPVTDRSILSLKRRALRRVKTIGMDAESQDRTSASKIRRFIERLKAPFTKVFWQDLFEETDHEKLVDRGLLSYAYLEAGIIETISGLLVYFVVFWKCGFTPAEVWNAQKAGVYFVEGAPNFVNSRGQVIDAAHQLDGFAQAQSSVYLSIFINQCFNVFAVKAKLTFPFGRRVVSNKWNFVGILIGASLGTFVIYTPPLHIVFGGSHHLLPLYWLIPAAFGILLLIWASIRVILLRKSIQDKTVKDIKGLMMFPTMRTMSVKH
ncbi:Sodium/potassium-transporting ATPase subunit alpha-1 [Leucoagaricus sp. SymC.cos]|nr:Sodium/potassium-transporting ATPase subunit alpha-1 [Leucoagaricus sp. SymC.cos]